MSAIEDVLVAVAKAAIAESGFDAEQAAVLHGLPFYGSAGSGAAALPGFLTALAAEGADGDKIARITAVLTAVDAAADDSQTGVIGRTKLAVADLTDGEAQFLASYLKATRKLDADPNERPARPAPAPPVVAAPVVVAPAVPPVIVVPPQPGAAAAARRDAPPAQPARQAQPPAPPATPPARVIGTVVDLDAAFGQAQPPAASQARPEPDDERTDPRPVQPARVRAQPRTRVADDAELDGGGHDHAHGGGHDHAHAVPAVTPRLIWHVVGAIAVLAVLCGGFLGFLAWLL